ncbi:hypothetical protein QVD17_19815 [Tagetes erecta]|uniref:3-hydroxyisobutyryl-CoA hydrolase n=1 Tax=Tagetes erecta TaxID=13708 RepID=A0AAD8NQF1_TARER|nr:hypothetical protein QVD17_19815 [Tagetes erecta]
MNVREIEECLKNLITDDPSIIETSLEKYSDFHYPDNNSVLKRMEMVDRCFSHDSVEEIIGAVESEAAKTNHKWCDSLRSGVNLRMVDKDFAPKVPNVRYVVVVRFTPSLFKMFN